METARVTFMSQNLIKGRMSLANDNFYAVGGLRGGGENNRSLVTKIMIAIFLVFAFLWRHTIGALFAGGGHHRHHYRPQAAAAYYPPPPQAYPYQAPTHQAAGMGHHHPAPGGYGRGAPYAAAPGGYPPVATPGSGPYFVPPAGRGAGGSAGGYFPPPPGA